MRQEIADSFQTIQIKIKKDINIPMVKSENALEAKAGDTILCIDGSYYGTTASTSSPRKQWFKLRLLPVFIEVNTPTFFKEEV